MFGFTIYLEKSADKLEDCDVRYEKVGCYNEDIRDRALADQIFNMRNNISWKPGEWEMFLKRQVLVKKVT